MIESTVSSVLKETHDLFADGFQLLDLLGLTAVIMKLIQMREHLKGHGKLKKEIALLVFEKFIYSTDLFTPEQAKEASAFLVQGLPTVIDSMKYLSKSIGASARFKCWCF